MRTVLVVEPSPALRQSIINVIQPTAAVADLASAPEEARHVAYQVIEAEDGVEALKHLPRMAFDLVIVNEGLPDISGLSILSFVRKNPASQHMPVMIVQAGPSADPQITAQALGANACVAQPLDPVMLRQTIQTLLLGESHG